MLSGIRDDDDYVEATGEFELRIVCFIFWAVVQAGVVGISPGLTALGSLLRCSADED